MKVRLTLKSRNLSKDGSAPIYVECAFSKGEKRYIPTGKRIPPSAWNMEKHEVRKTYADYQQMNAVIKARLREVESVVDKSILEREVLTPDQLMIRLDGGVLTRKKQESLIPYIEEWIRSMSGTKTKTVITDYRALMRHLSEYALSRNRTLGLRDLNDRLYDDFRKYLETEVRVSSVNIGMKPNSVGKQIKNLKVFLRYLMKHNVIDRMELSEFKKPAEAGDHIYLNETEIEHLLHVDIERTALARTRDMFIVGCETGLRFSDFSALNKDHIEGNFIKKPTKKTGKKVQIPISRRLSVVLARQGGDFPRGVNSVVFNRQIKEVCKIAGFDTIEHKQERRGIVKREMHLPKWAMVSSHTCRRSFCTNQFLRGIPTFLIRKISGHATEKAFLQYIRIDEEQAAEEMAKMWASHNQ